MSYFECINTNEYIEINVTLFDISNESKQQYNIYLPIFQKWVLYSIDSTPWLEAPSSNHLDPNEKDVVMGAIIQY
jgi:hypothetical protein